MKIPYQKDFNNNFSTGDKISAKVSKYDKTGLYNSRLPDDFISRNYTIGKTDIKNDCHGHVELIYLCDGELKSMIVEYQWFDNGLTGRLIKKLN